MIGDFAGAEQQLFPDHTAQGKTLAFVAEDNESAEIAVKLFSASWLPRGDDRLHRQQHANATGGDERLHALRREEHDGQRG